LAYPERIWPLLGIAGAVFIGWCILHDINHAIDSKFRDLHRAIDRLGQRVDRLESKIDGLKGRPVGSDTKF
jgi:hypothetical protein